MLIVTIQENNPYSFCSVKSSLKIVTFQFIFSQKMDSSIQIISKNNNFKCEICEKCFKTNHLKNQHLRTVHGEEKKFQCNVCSQIFGEKNKLKSHEDQKTALGRKFCGKTCD